MMALSRMLFRLAYGSFPKSGYRLTNLIEESYHNNLQQIGNLDRLFKLDLKDSLRIIPIPLILSTVKPLVGDGPIYKLIESFLSLPIIDDNGNDRSSISMGGMPVSGEISRLLFNIVLLDIFDQKFRKWFPGIAFCRFHYDVFILTRGSVIFDEKAGYALIEEVGLAGEIASIGRCDYPIPSISLDKYIYLDNEGKVHIFSPEECFNLFHGN